MSSASPRSARWILVGVVVALIGATVAVAVWMIADTQADRRAAGLARAPVGCETTLEFADAGVFVVYAETRGRHDPEGAVDADDSVEASPCRVPSRYDHRQEIPSLSVAIADGSGREVPLVPTAVGGYDTQRFSARALAEFEVGEPGRYVVRADADQTGSVGATDVVVTVGNDPTRWVVPARLIGTTGGLVLVVFGAALIVVGLVGRRRRTAAASGTTDATGMPSPWERPDERPVPEWRPPLPPPLPPPPSTS